MSRHLKGFPRHINNDLVVGFTSTQKVKMKGWEDLSTLADWYQEDPNKKHFGLVSMFSEASDFRMPSYKKMFQEGAVYEVIGADGSFLYELPVETDSGCYTVGDTSTYSEAHGIDGSVFPIRLNKEYRPGDVLTYDAYYGEDIVVSEDYVVKREGDAFIHMVQIATQNAAAYYPADKLKAGIQYFKIGNILGEYSEQFSGIESMGSELGTVTCRFTLGNHRGVEGFVTQYADMKSFNGASVNTKQYLNQFLSEAQSAGTDQMGNPLNLVFFGKKKANGKIDASSMKLTSLMEYLIILELMKLESYQIQFQKGGIIKDVHGTKRLNEGIHHQKRRGYIIEYPRPNHVSPADFLKAAAYIFRSRRDLAPHERRMRWNVGRMMYQNIMQIFKTEVNSQLAGLGVLMGSEKFLPKSPVSGTDLTSLKLEPVMFTEVYLPEIGMVSINHEPSMDYMPLSDRRSSGFYGDGYAHTSFSAVIDDVTDEVSTNVMTNIPQGVKLIEGGKKFASQYYIKPEGDNFWWGTRDGRYSRKAGEIHASLKKMGTETFAHSISAGFVPDPSSSVTIELKRN